MEKGKFIVFEGGEFVGKTTQLHLLARRLEREGYAVVETREPGGTPEGKKLREKVMAGGLSPIEELDCFMEDRRIHVEKVIKPALVKGIVVLCDRFEDSTRAYQHFGRGHARDLIEQKNKEARGDVEPDLVVILDMDPVEAFKRARGRGEELTTFEKENMDFHHTIRNGFLRIAEEDPKKYFVVSAGVNLQDLIVLNNTIWERIQERVLS